MTVVLKQAGNHLRSRRHAQGFSQAHLAKFMRSKGHQWDSSAVSRMENGERDLRLTEVVALCELLETSPDAIAGHNHSGKFTPPVAPVIDYAIAQLIELRGKVL